MCQLLGPLILFSAAMSLTPGPNVIMVTASAANFGFVRTVPQILGITFGFGALVVAVGVGLAGLFQAEPRLHLILKYGGAAYLLYLAWCIARSGDADGETSQAKPIGPFKAALLQWLNPKAWILAVGALAAYTTAAGGLWESLLVGGVITAAVFLSVAIWAGFGAAIKRFLNSPRAHAIFNWSMAALLVVSIVPVFWEFRTP